MAITKVYFKNGKYQIKNTITGTIYKRSFKNEAKSKAFAEKIEEKQSFHYDVNTQPSAYMPIAGLECLCIMDNRFLKDSMDASDYVTLRWQGKLFWRKLYYAPQKGVWLKFFNQRIYLSEFCF